MEVEASFICLDSFTAVRRCGVTDSHNERLESFERNYNWMHGLDIQSESLLSTYQVKVVHYRCKRNPFSLMLSRNLVYFLISSGFPFFSLS